jgi:hypothetical protein
MTKRTIVFDTDSIEGQILLMLARDNQHKTIPEIVGEFSEDQEQAVQNAISEISLFLESAFTGYGISYRFSQDFELIVEGLEDEKFIIHVQRKTNE